MIKTNVTGETKVFANEFNNNGELRIAYSTTIGKKKFNEDGYDDAFIQLRFRKGVTIPDRTVIEIQEGWLSFYLNKDNKPVWYIFVNKFDTDSQEAPVGGSQLQSFAEIDEEVPF